jgi:hypothetical protein
VNRKCLLVIALATVCTADNVAAEPSASWVGDVRFLSIHDMYWRAHLQNRYAGNRICALKPTPRFDDPKSPLRPLDQRLTAIGERIETVWPGALNRVARPYQMVPPQSKCDDQSAAWEAIFALETTITAAERLLDNLGPTPKPSQREKQ